jgi:hypothetical protein
MKGRKKEKHVMMAMLLKQKIKNQRSTLYFSREAKQTKTSYQC